MQEGGFDETIYVFQTGEITFTDEDIVVSNEMYNQIEDNDIFTVSSDNYCYIHVINSDDVVSAVSGADIIITLTEEHISTIEAFTSLSIDQVNVYARYTKKW